MASVGGGSDGDTNSHGHQEDRGERGKREGIRELRVRWGSGGEVTGARDDGRRGRSEMSKSESKSASDGVRARESDAAGEGRIFLS